MNRFVPLPSTEPLSTRQRSTAPGRITVMFDGMAPFTATSGGKRTLLRCRPASRSTDPTNTLWMSIRRSR
jgi:hypothetical protein